MYKVTKTMEIAVGHKLDLPYDSPCRRLHGHNLKITVCVKSYELTKYGMVIDFSKISETVKRLDHRNINEIIEGNPTAENIAHWITDEINLILTNDGYPESTRVDYVIVRESEGNEACYEE